MPSVHDLATRLGTDVVTVPVVPDSLDVEFTSVVIYDPLEQPEFGQDDLVLAVGVTATSVLAHQLTAARPAALLLRHDGPLRQSLIAEAIGAGVALLDRKSVV